MSFAKHSKNGLTTPLDDFDSSHTTMIQWTRGKKSFMASHHVFSFSFTVKINLQKDK